MVGHLAHYRTTEVHFNKYFEGMRLAEPCIVQPPSLEILKIQQNGQPVVADTDLSQQVGLSDLKR